MVNMVNFKTSQSLSWLLSISLGLSTAVSSTNVEITWSKCPGAKDTQVVDCGHIKVPLAYFNTTHGIPHDIDLDKALSSGSTIALGMARLKATGPNRLGSLIINPGCPGGVASNYTLGPGLHGGPSLFGTTLVAHYDIIGLDPRGVGMSQPVKCDPDIWNERPDIFATTDAEFDKLVDHNKKAGESCKRLTGPMIDHLDTIHVVHDMELVRRALGDKKLNFLGTNYGTQIGSQYAEYFPENIGRMALDGIVNHAQSEPDTVSSESTTFEATLKHFFDWCAKSKSCVLHGQDVASLFDKLINDANQKPIPAKGCQKMKTCRPFVTGNDILSATQDMLVLVKKIPGYPFNRADLPKMLAAAIQGDATDLSSPLAQGKVDGEYPGLAIMCQDWLHTAQDATDLRQLIQMLHVVAPHTRGSSQSLQAQTLCLGWPAPVSNPQHLLNERVRNAPPILMVNSYFDPYTSIVWANGVKKQLPTASLVYRKGAGHTSYPLGGDVTKAVDKYLITGTMPKDGTVFDS